MDKKIKIQLEADVRPEDFTQSFQPIITAIGIKAALDLCRYSGGIQHSIYLCMTKCWKGQETGP